MNIPSQIRAGDTIKWRDVAGADNLGNAITSAAWTLTYYLRFDHNNEGSTVVGTAYGSGWEFVISQATSAAFDVGQWYFQAEATKSGEHVTLGAGQFTVLPSLSYTGDRKSTRLNSSH